MSTKPRTLVTTGNSRTGAAAVTELLRRDFPVRALVRKDDHRAHRLREAGAEVVVGSFYDIRDLRVALKDVQRVYHSSPHDPRVLHNSMLVSLAAEEAGVEVVALMSTWNPHATHPSVTEREHWMANNIYRRIQSFDVIHIHANRTTGRSNACIDWRWVGFGRFGEHRIRVGVLRIHRTTH